MDFDFGIGKKSHAKSGRRSKSSKANTSMNSNEKESATPTEAPTPALEVGKDSPPRPSRRIRGWGDGGGKKDKEKTVQDSRLLMSNVTDSPRSRFDSSEEDEKEIQVIPDLDDVHGANIIQEMAAPPSVAMNQVATYRELDSDLQRHSSFTLLDNEIDLKLLAKHMSPESEIREDDETWDWDRLFTQVSSNLKSQPKVKTETHDNLI